jgi:hypothetical protein
MAAERLPQRTLYSKEERMDAMSTNSKPEYVIRSYVKLPDVGDEWNQLILDIAKEIHAGRYEAEQDPDGVSFETSAGRLFFVKPDED